MSELGKLSVSCKNSGRLMDLPASALMSAAFGQSKTKCDSVFGPFLHIGQVLMGFFIRFPKPASPKRNWVRIFLSLIL